MSDKDNKPSLVQVNFSKPKPRSEINDRCMSMLHELLSELNGDDIFGMAVVLITDDNIMDFHICEDRAYQLIGAVDCLKDRIKMDCIEGWAE